MNLVNQKRELQWRLQVVLRQPAKNACRRPAHNVHCMGVTSGFGVCRSDDDDDDDDDDDYYYYYY